MVEKLVDVERLLRAQHDVQEDSAETDRRPLSLQKGKNNKLTNYILTKRRCFRNVKDAEANDMIHMGSDHRCIMATFLINTPGKDTHARREKEKHETIGFVEHEQKEK